MRRKIFNTSTVLIILVISILLGFLFSLIYGAIEKASYPRKYSDAVSRYSAEFSVPEELIYATIKIESNFDPNAVSHAGAVGLMQMLPSTCEWLSGKLGDEFDPNMLYDPETNIKYGTYYLQYLYSRFGSWEKASAAYNWGEGNFSKFLEEHGYRDGNYSSIPVKETRSYVEKVNKAKTKYLTLYY